MNLEKSRKLQSREASDGRITTRARAAIPDISNTYRIQPTFDAVGIIRPWGMWTKVSGDSTNPRFHGRAYQCVVLPNDIAMGTKVTLPIDAGLSGLFMVCGIPAWTTARIAIRIG